MTFHAWILRKSTGIHTLWIGVSACWFLGYLIGYSFADSSFLSLMHSALLQPVSIVGLFVCIFLPLLLTWVSVSLNKPVIILTVCLTKAIAFGFSCKLLLLTAGSAAWLYRVLFLFSDSCILIVLFMTWFRFFSFKAHLKPNNGIVLFCATAIAIVDYSAISPYLLGLL